MDEYTEGLFVIAVYLFVVTAFTLPFIIVYLSVRILKLINRISRFLMYAEQNEEESRKYHE